MEKGPRKYGLIISSKKKQTSQNVKQLSAFAESSSEDEDERKGKQLKTGALWRENKKNAQKVESRGQVTKALEEDPSVFEYDSIYDQMQEKKRRSDPRLVTKDKSSKYIANLKKVAERRKLEQEIIYERKVQRELEREGKQAEDQETFLTSAYRKKLEERRNLEEELKLEAYHEERDDVTKQKDMSRFHRNLLEEMTSDGSSKKPETRRRRSNNERHVEEDVNVRKRTEREDEIEEDDLAEDREADGNEDSSSLEPESHADDSFAPVVDSGATDRPNLDENTTRETEKEVDPPRERVVEEITPEVSKEEKRKIVAAKRTNEESMSSAKERYLARKKAKLSAPVISTDD